VSHGQTLPLQTTVLSHLSAYQTSQQTLSLAIRRGHKLSLVTSTFICNNILLHSTEYLNSINQCIYYVVRTEYLRVIRVDFRLHRVTHLSATEVRHHQRSNMFQQQIDLSLQINWSALCDANLRIESWQEVTLWLYTDYKVTSLALMIFSRPATQTSVQCSLC
jgi:hypothetical protein